MTAVLLVDVIDTAAVLADAILAWIVAAAVVVTIVLVALAVAGVGAWRAIRRGLSARLPAPDAPEAPRSLPTPERRPTPRWAQPPDEKPQKAA
ncbi:hypothetical protein [Streptomyces sp. NPDC096324]|uniref:hypothetical protein n=1 Tax=Streptomyces sp. NPDC096324 TaxID=3366085 RepID=UPI00381763F0